MNKSEQLIACLEGEIAKRDAELERLRAKTTTTMGVGSGDGRLFIHGDYESVKAAQGIVIERDQLRAELAAIKAQEPAAYIPVDRETGEEWHPVLKKGSGNICDYKPLYAAPVAEAKAQGVVMPERKTKADYGVYIDEFADEAAAIYNAALDEVARLNAAPVQQVSVSDDFPGMWHESDLIGGETDCAEQSLKIKRFTPISAGDYIPTMNLCSSGKWMKVEQHLHILAAAADLLAAAKAVIDGLRGEVERLRKRAKTAEREAGSALRTCKGLEKVARVVSDNSDQVCGELNVTRQQLNKQAQRIGELAGLLRGSRKHVAYAADHCEQAGMELDRIDAALSAGKDGE